MQREREKDGGPKSTQLHNTSGFKNLMKLNYKIITRELGGVIEAGRKVTTRGREWMNPLVMYVPGSNGVSTNAKNLLQLPYLTVQREWLGWSLGSRRERVKRVCQRTTPRLRKFTVYQYTSIFISKSYIMSQFLLLARILEIGLSHTQVTVVMEIITIPQTHMVVELAAAAL